MLVRLKFRQFLLHLDIPDILGESCPVKARIKNQEE